MGPLQLVFKEAAALLQDGISVIPVRDKEEIINGKTHKRKQPFKGWQWTKYQSERLTEEALWFHLEKLDTTAIATICGKISGNLEAIDIDSKWQPGIDKLLFDEIKSVFPGLIDTLRINKTPSGGFHILYRVEIGVTLPGNEKLASRLSTEEELLADPKSKVKCFLETRAEGGYVVAPPSLGYTTVKANPLPILTAEQRDGLIKVCQSFNEVAKEDRTYSPSASESVYYEENPFENFNNSVDAEQVLMNFGWTYHSKNARALYFTRPGSKSGDIHATFLFGCRMFMFFTTNSEFENNRRYKPATVLGRLAFGNDMKACFRDIVGRGFGRVKADVAAKIVQKAIISGQPLPANVAVIESAAKAFEEGVVKMAKECPYGMFWEFNEKNKPEISRENLYDVSHKLGFRVYNGDLYQIIDKFIYKRDQKYYFDEAKSYLPHSDPDVHIELCNTLEAFFQKSGEFTIERLRDIEESEILFDTEDKCFKFFRDGYVLIEADKRLKCNYSTLDKLIFESRIQKRNMPTDEFIGGMYMEFMELACRYSEVQGYINRIIGFLAHEYKDTSTPYIITLTEECPDPKDGGGSGKNLFCDLLELTTTFTEQSGSQVNLDERFLQSWNGEKVIAISDVPKDFDFSFLKNLSGGRGKVKKLYKDQITIDVKEMPKFILQTNFGIGKKDGGLERRVRQIEFTDFFTKCGGVDIHFGGKRFPNDWEEEDWIGYDNFIFQCIQEWLSANRKVEKRNLSIGGLAKQFDSDHGEATRMFIEEHWEEWIKEVYVQSEKINKQYLTYCIDNGIIERYRKTSKSMTVALRDWCREKRYEFNPNTIKRLKVWENIMGEDVQVEKVCKCKYFSPIDAPF